MRDEVIIEFKLFCTFNRLDRLKSRFEQRDYLNCYAKVESTLLLAARGEPFDEHILAICYFYGKYFNQHNLQTQITLLGTLFHGLNKDSICY